MRTRMFGMTALLAALAIAPALAQPPAAPRAPRAPQAPQAPKAPKTPEAPVPPPAPPRRVGQPVNVKIEVTISDQGRTDAPTLKKTVSVVTADGLNGRIRSMAEYMNIGMVPLNVDAEPELLSDGKIRVRVNLQYDLPGGGNATGPELTKVSGPLKRTQIQENLSLVLENGKPLIAAQSADPVGDRQVTIEVKATVLR